MHILHKPALVPSIFFFVFPQVLVQPTVDDVRQACFYIPWAPLRLGLAHNLHQRLTDTE
jgi:hypothetical protein